MTTKITQPLTHEQMVKQMLKNSDVRSEVDRLNREEFTELDKTLTSKKEAIQKAI